MKKNKNWLVLILGLVLIFGLGQAAQAALTALGPPNPNTTSGTNGGVFGFPQWYEDGNGLTLELCLPNAAEQAAGACISTPVPVFPIVFPTNFPDEIFYFAATPPDLVVPAGGALSVAGSAGLTLALEAAFSTGAVITEGAQITFGRLRYRVDVPGPGTYTVTTPYGIFTEEVITPGIKAINVSRDIGIGGAGVFTGALASDIGPYLRASATPGGPALPLFADPALLAGAFYLSPPGALTAVTGGPFGNIFRVDGPNIGGVGVNFVQTDQFVLQGRLFNGGTPTPLSGARATYSRPVVGTGFVEVFANSAPTATLTISPAGQIPATTMITGNPLNPSDPSYGKFSARIPITQQTILPATLAITADNTLNNPLNTNTTTGSTLVDLVTITAAEYDPVLRTLTIQAVSSDEASPPLLTAPGFGTLTSGKITVNNVISPPTVVTVSSSKGGSGTHEVFSVPPVSAARATYCRPAVGNGAVDVFANATSTAILTVSDPTGKIPTTIMTTDPNSGNFFAKIPITSSTVLPAVLTITADNSATNPGIPPISIGVDLEDLVTITLAEYDQANKILNIKATSCDALTPPVLTAVGFGKLTSGNLNVKNVNVPPSVLSVSSSKGGLDTSAVTISSLRRYLPAIMKP